MNRVDGKTAIVTGGARGIGAATVRLLVEGGARVLITDRDETAGRALAATFDETSVQFATHDVTEPDQWSHVVETAQRWFGRVDALVNNAGVSRIERLEEMSLADWRAITSVNLDGVFLGTQAAVRAMRDDGGAIVNVSSIMGIVGGAGPAYNASKGGVRLLTKSVATWCARHGYAVRVNSVHPGYVHTQLIDGALAELDPERDGATADEAYAGIVARHPMGRMGEPEEIARGIVFLASDDSSFMTGAELVIDGGYTAS